MSRLRSEWHRLFFPHAWAGATATVDGDEPALIDAEGRVRAMVLSLALPADWDALSTVWKAVQADLGLPAPGIAVSGTDAFQLWFSLAQAAPAREADAFLASLRERYLRGISAERIRSWPAPDAGAPGGFAHVGRMPGQEVRREQWSAFVAPDLAAMFSDTPWLDIPPGPEGQAELLAGLRSITPVAWRMARNRLEPLPAASPVDDAPPPIAPSRMTHQDPRRFLLDVMNDDAVDLVLRIEAAKALLLNPAPR